MHIERVQAVTPDVLEALKHLVPQLTSRHPAVHTADIEALVAGASSSLFIARAPDAAGRIVGAACLVVYRVTTGIRAILEDVVVDQESRGHGRGEALAQQALDLARDVGVPGVSLTSNPRREAANRLYLRLGFKRRETNAYYFAFT